MNKLIVKEYLCFQLSETTILKIIPTNHTRDKIFHVIRETPYKSDYFTTNIEHLCKLLGMDIPNLLELYNKQK